MEHVGGIVKKIFDVRTVFRHISLTTIFALFIYVFFLKRYLTDGFFSSSEQAIFLLSWLGILLFIYIVYSWNRVTGFIFTPYIIFITFLFLFNFGQCFMWALNIHLPSEIGKGPIYPGWGIPETWDIIKTQVYVLLNISIFHLGALYAQLIFFKWKERREGVKKYESKEMLSAIGFVSKRLAFIVIPITIFENIKNYQIASAYGYRALHYSEFAKRGGATINGMIEQLFFPVIVGILLGTNYSRRGKRIAYSTMLLFLFLNLAFGDRGPWIFKIILLIWLHHIFNEKISFTKTLKYSPLFFLSIYLLDAIVIMRNSGISFETILSSFSLSNSSITKAFFELGSSMSPTLHLLKYNWDIWPYKNSYFLAITGVVTNKIFHLLDWGFETVSSFFKNLLGIKYGPGFSIIAEPLMNFGPFFGPFFMFVLGWFFSKLLAIKETDESHLDPLRILFVATTTEIFLKINRANIHVLLKNWLWGPVLFSTFIFLFFKIKSPNKIT